LPLGIPQKAVWKFRNRLPVHAYKVQIEQILKLDNKPYHFQLVEDILPYIKADENYLWSNEATFTYQGWCIIITA
jgi:hypothetical protein